MISHKYFNRKGWCSALEPSMNLWEMLRRRLSFHLTLIFTNRIILNSAPGTICPCSVCVCWHCHVVLIRDASVHSATGQNTQTESIQEYNFSVLCLCRRGFGRRKLPAGWNDKRKQSDLWRYGYARKQIAARPIALPAENLLPVSSFAFWLQTDRNSNSILKRFFSGG